MSDAIPDANRLELREKLESVLKEFMSSPWASPHEAVRLAKLMHKTDRTADQTDRLAVGMSLWKLLLRHGDKLEPGDCYALSDLTEALALLEEGVVAPLFRPHKFSGGRDMSRRGRQVTFGLVSGCIALENLGLSKKHAMAELAKLCRTLNLQASGQRAITVGTIYSWWKKYRDDYRVKEMARYVDVLSEQPTPRGVIRKLTELLIYPYSDPSVEAAKRLGVRPLS